MISSNATERLEKSVLGQAGFQNSGLAIAGPASRRNAAALPIASVRPRILDVCTMVLFLRNDMQPHRLGPGQQPQGCLSSQSGEDGLSMRSPGSRAERGQTDWASPVSADRTMASSAPTACPISPGGMGNGAPPDDAAANASRHSRIVR